MLLDFVENTYSQHGDDGMIAEALRCLEIERGFCVEFGANDGLSCSNTLLLREAGWEALLIEGDPALYSQLGRYRTSSVECMLRMLEPTGENSIDFILNGRPVDFMSIDIDGDDYGIIAEMQTRPKLLMVEYNPSVPWFLDIRALGSDNTFGASSLAMYRLLAAKEFTLVGANYANLFFVPRELERMLDQHALDYVNTMAAMPLRSGFVVSDYLGNPVAIDTARLPWGVHGRDGVVAIDEISLENFEQELVFGEPFKQGRRYLQGFNQQGDDLWVDY